jgi:hypothetical protein
MLQRVVNYKGTVFIVTCGQISGARYQGNTKRVMTEIRDSTTESKLQNIKIISTLTIPNDSAYFPY